MQNLVTLWGVLFNEEYEDILDPNKPENTARMKVESEIKKDKFRKFIEGIGKGFFDETGKELKKKLVALISSPAVEECNCRICIDLREIRYITQFLIKAEMILSEKEK